MPFVLIDKIKAVIREDNESEKILEDFILENIGRITLGKESDQTIQTLLKELNNQQNEY